MSSVTIMVVEFFCLLWGLIMDSEKFKSLSPDKLFLHCAIPSMVTMVFGALYQVADGLFVGRFIGGDALAAVSLIMPIIMIVFAVANMIATGASVRISILLGEKRREEASRVFSYSIKVIFLISCIVGAIGLIFADPLVRFFSPNATEEAVKYGITYLRIHALFAPLLPVYFATDNFLRVCGKERLSMWIGIGTQLFNIILDIILIAILGQGIWAAAFSTCLAIAAGSIITLLAFRGGRLDICYTKGTIPGSVFRRIVINGSSEFFSNISTSIMFIIYNFFLLKLGGTTAVAAFSVIMYVDSIIGMLVFGMSDAMQPAISYCYGAGLTERVKAIFKRVIICAILLSAASTLFMYYAGRYVAPIFIKPEDTELLAVSIIGMKLFAVSYLTGWVDMCYSSYFTALERAARSLLTSLFGTLIFPVAFLSVLTSFWQLKGVWLTPLASCTASAIFALILAATMREKAERGKSNE